MPALGGWHDGAMAKQPAVKAPTKRKPPPLRAPQQEEPVPLRPVTRKIGEGSGNLKGRSDAFSSRRGKTP